MFVCDRNQARFIDQRASEKYKIPSLILMEHAAIQLFNQIQKYRDKKILILCGPGNNGGDGMALARLCYQASFDIQVSYTGHTMSESQKTQYESLVALGIPILTKVDEIINEIHSNNILVDCLFGNGCTREIQGDFATIIEAMNQSKAYTISVDVPSGLDATSGSILGHCVKANITYALDCFKEGLLVQDGPKVAGTLECLDIGIVHEENDGMIWIDQDLVQSLLPQRSPFSHKGTYGKALIIGGSQSMPGALSMAAKACYASGIGTLSLMVPACISDLILTKIDFAMRLVSSDEDGMFSKDSIDLLKNNIENYDVISIGNGMGRNSVTKELVKVCLESDKPVLLDADAFWAIQDQNELLNRAYPTIVTPHIKECAMVLQTDTQTVAQNPIVAAREFAQKYPEVVLVLKSHSTFIVQGNKEYVFSHPNSALSKGGSGDLLSGILCGLYGQSKEALNSAIVGVYLHNQSANTKKDPAVAGPDDFLEKLNHQFKTLRKR